MLKTRNKKRLRIYRLPTDKNPLIARRTSLIQSFVSSSLKTFLTGERSRNCITCGISFKPVHRFHFNCTRPCLKTWNSGQLRPRSES